MAERSCHPLNQSRLYKIGSRLRLQEIIGVSRNELKFLLRSTDNYARFVNKSGRDVQSPKPILRRVQKRIGDLLARVETPEYLHSAKRGRSYLTNAAEHAPELPTVKVDVRKFFQSARPAMVYHFFLKKMQCAPDVASILTKLLTIDSHLPTGGNASPILSYFAYMEMFDEIHSLSVQQSCNMTLLMDDMTFTGQLATRRLIFEVRRIITRHSLWVHKTKLFKAGQPKVITGVAVTQRGNQLPNRRKAAIRGDLRSLRFPLSDDDRILILRRVKGRMYEAAQIEPRWRKRAEIASNQLKALERRLHRGAGRPAPTTNTGDAG
jgi:RNA-directed DNA polymerase